MGARSGRQFLLPRLELSHRPLTVVIARWGGRHTRSDFERHRPRPTAPGCEAEALAPPQADIT